MLRLRRRLQCWAEPAFRLLRRPEPFSPAASKDATHLDGRPMVAFDVVQCDSCGERIPHLLSENVVEENSPPMSSCMNVTFRLVGCYDGPREACPFEGDLYFGGASDGHRVYRREPSAADDPCAVTRELVEQLALQAGLQARMHAERGEWDREHGYG